MELYIEPIRQPKPTRVGGRFTKGFTPHNKGKCWNDWLPKETQEIMRKKAVANLERVRGTYRRPDVAERSRTAVIALYDDNSFRMFVSQDAAASILGICRRNIGRCCANNAKPKPDKRRGERNGTTNTNHKYMNIRWYYESDTKWMDKIAK